MSSSVAVSGGEPRGRRAGLARRRWRAPPAGFRPGAQGARGVDGAGAHPGSTPGWQWRAAPARPAAARSRVSLAPPAAAGSAAAAAAAAGRARLPAHSPASAGRARPAPGEGRRPSDAGRAPPHVQDQAHDPTVLVLERDGEREPGSRSLPPGSRRSQPRLRTMSRPIGSGRAPSASLARREPIRASVRIAASMRPGSAAPSPASAGSTRSPWAASASAARSRTSRLRSPSAAASASSDPGVPASAPSRPTASARSRSSAWLRQAATERGGGAVPGVDQRAQDG